MINHEDSFDAGSECSLPGSPRSRVPSPSMERLDRLVRSGGLPGVTEPFSPWNKGGCTRGRVYERSLTGHAGDNVSCC